MFVSRCDVIPFDMTGNNNDTGAPIDEKSNQWFGATVSSSGENGVVVVSFVRIINSPPSTEIQPIQHFKINCPGDLFK